MTECRNSDDDFYFSSGDGLLFTSVVALLGNVVFVGFSRVLLLLIAITIVVVIIIIVIINQYCVVDFNST